jgi:hypothetical protein
MSKIKNKKVTFCGFHSRKHTKFEVIRTSTVQSPLLVNENDDENLSISPSSKTSEDQ